ncbi:hypothetical protein DVK00_07950 [Haloarcula sp. Atlit-47R]|uniref:hypothetical protein n=1 Tax=Haloarcula sp. Atlit-47R TaxID=2282132 RepID=UPI000EF20B36|nr:hypothetical protein [Haloarcula sp. Atlit-47R]RLM44391.1 hypothetical protein DVK00_07950 [Haloarcula sp. Atlit-47R]
MNVEDRYRYLIDEDRIELKPSCEPAKKIDSLAERWMAIKAEYPTEVVRSPLNDLTDGLDSEEIKGCTARHGRFRFRESQHFANLWLNGEQEYGERRYGLVVLRPDGDDYDVVDDAVVPVGEVHTVASALYGWTERGDGERELALPWQRTPWLQGCRRKRRVR